MGLRQRSTGINSGGSDSRERLRDDGKVTRARCDRRRWASISRMSPGRQKCGVRPCRAISFTSTASGFSAPTRRMEAEAVWVKPPVGEGFMSYDLSEGLQPCGLGEI